MTAKPATAHPEPPQSATAKDIVDELGEELFPASDPPASPMTHLGAPRTSATPTVKNCRQKRRAWRQRTTDGP